MILAVGLLATSVYPMVPLKFSSTVDLGVAGQVERTTVLVDSALETCPGTAIMREQGLTITPLHIEMLVTRSFKVSPRCLVMGTESVFGYRATVVVQRL